MAEDRSIIKKEFYIIASSYYSNKYRKGDFFYLGKITVYPKKYKINYIDSKAIDMAITYKAKYGSKYNNDYDKNDIINLKTYGDIFKFEKKC